MILGLTGGMGCGKTTAAGMLAAHGFAPLDSDAIIRTVVLTDKAVITAIRDHFGADVLTEAGEVDRGRLARRIFPDDAALRWLEDLLHPRLFAYWRTAFARDQNWFDFTVCIASDPTVQLARLEQRGIPPPLARQRISKQLPLTQKIKLVDFVILNDGSPDFLRDQVGALVRSLSAL